MPPVHERERERTPTTSTFFGPQVQKTMQQSSSLSIDIRIGFRRFLFALLADDFIISFSLTTLTGICIITLFRMIRSILLNQCITHRSLGFKAEALMNGVERFS